MPRKPKAPDPPPKPKRRSPGNGTVGLRKDGRVYACLPSDLDPKRKPIYRVPGGAKFASVEQARAWLDAEVARRRNPPAPVSASKAEPLGAYLERWYHLHSPGWPERTRLAYGSAVRHWASIGDVPVGDLTREAVQSGIAAMQRATWQRFRKDGTPIGEPKPYSRRTIQLARSVLHQALDVLVPDVLAHNPTARARTGGRVADTEQPVWSSEQAARFLATAERVVPQFALAFRLILRRALRIGEAIALTWADVDEPASVLRVDETAGIRRGLSGPTKTRKIRDVPLSTDLAARLRAHRRAYPATDPHVFTVDGERVSATWLRGRWHHVVRVASLPSITPKDGRATCATSLLDAGHPLPEVSRLLGHASVATTANFYARVVKRRAEQTARLGERLDTLLDGAPEDAEGDAVGS